jgi:hypothetical protein
MCKVFYLYNKSLDYFVISELEFFTVHSLLCLGSGTQLALDPHKFGSRIWNRICIQMTPGPDPEKVKRTKMMGKPRQEEDRYLVLKSIGSNEISLKMFIFFS